MVPSQTHTAEAALTACSEWLSLTSTAMRRLLLALAGQQHACCCVCSCPFQAIMWDTQWCTPSLAVTGTPCTLLEDCVLYRILVLCPTVYAKVRLGRGWLHKSRLAVVSAITARQPLVSRNRPHGVAPLSPFIPSLVQ